MNNSTTNITIAYDPKIISRIKEMIIEGFDKLKSFVTVKKQSYEIYDEIKNKFDEISLKLEGYEFFNEELDYFLMITEKILYIIQKNCENPSFGHCNFALELFDFFIDVWDEKIRLINDSSDLTKYEHCQNIFKRKYFEYNEKFYKEIHVNNDFPKEKFYRIMESMRE